MAPELGIARGSGTRDRQLIHFGYHIAFVTNRVAAGGVPSRVIVPRIPLRYRLGR